VEFRSQMQGKEQVVVVNFGYQAAPKLMVRLGPT
jgi:hypothetical protein